MALASDQLDLAEQLGQRWPNRVYRYLLVLRFGLVNIVATGLAVAVYLQGWLNDALVGYTWRLSLGIFFVFLFGMVLCAVKIWRTSAELNDVRAGEPRPKSRAGKYLAIIKQRGADSRALSANLLRLRLNNYISDVRYIANILVFLGLIGTVIGFIVALSGVNPESSSSVENIAPMVATLINGMSIALYTTLLGAVLHVWLMVNHRILASGTMHLYNGIVELGERVGE
ncbi:MAG: MotA/TolQ/ExbB proton channel family protein [Acidiferrobacterales bacterium]